MNEPSFGRRESATDPGLGIPPRTALFHLMPIASGSSLCEGLTSYLCRLADAHSVSVKDLLFSDHMAGFTRDYLCSPHGTRSSSWSRASASLNGIGIWARDAVRTLEPLVGQEDLSSLTMLPWSGVFPRRGLLHKTKFWCPICYREWRSQQITIYDPLLWSLWPIRVCARHHVPLQEICPACQAQVPWLSNHSIPGHCPSCGSPLWDDPPISSNAEELDPREWQWQRWVADSLGDLLSAAGGQLRQARAGRVSALYADSTAALFAGNMSEAARLAQVSPRTIREWVAHTQLPELGHFLTSCYCLSVAPADVLLGPAESPMRFQARMTLWPKDRPPRRPPRMLDKAVLQEELQAIASAMYLLPPSMADVARSMGIDECHLIRMFPGLCKQISSRYLESLSLSRRQTLSRTGREVRAIVRSAHDQRLYPGYDLVSSQLRHPWRMRLDEIRAVWKEALGELAANDRVSETHLLLARAEQGSMPP